MLRPLARSLVAATLLLAVAGIVPARAQDRIRLASPDAARRVRHIDFSDWLNAQTFPNTVIAFVGKSGNLAAVDCVGRRAQELGLSFGFSATGSVRVSELPDGTGEVLVNADFSNALTYVSNPAGDLILGYRFFQLPGNPSLVPGLSNGHLQLKYTVSDAASPELDILRVLFFGGGGGTVKMLKFHSEGTGPLRAAFGVPEGTPGTVGVGENDILSKPGGGFISVERVEVKVADGANVSAVSVVSPSGSNPSAYPERRAGTSSGEQAANATGQTVAGHSVSGT